MKNCKLVVGGSDQEAERLILAGLIEYNISKTGYYDSSPLLVHLSTEDNDTCLGGLIGRTYWGWLYIDAVWIPEDLRGRGLGRKLLQQAEQEAIRRDCHSAYLDTFDFQARSFYEKCGYVVFGKLDDFPFNHTRFFMSKRIGREKSGD